MFITKYPVKKGISGSSVNINSTAQLKNKVSLFMPWISQSLKRAPIAILQ